MLLSSSIECELRRRGQGFAGAAAEPAIAILRGCVERQLLVDAARDVAYRRFMCVLVLWRIKAPGATLPLRPTENGFHRVMQIHCRTAKAWARFFF